MFAALFPGQGSQKVGMGRAFAEGSAAARAVFERAEAALPGLLDTIWEGPEEALRLTENQQPALLAVSAAAWAAWREAGGPDPAYAAGHSLGEWSAHVAAGTLELEDALRLVRNRGRYMQEAVPEGEGAMAAILKLDEAAVREVVQRTEGVWIANLNSPGQVVISGRKEAVEAAAAQLKERRGRVVPLKVSAPFHSELMAPAREALARDLARVELRTPRFPVFSNVTAEPATDPERIRELLLAQITAPVRWVEILEGMHGRGVTTFVELGSGNVLTGLVRRTLPEARALNAEEPEGLAAALKEVVS
ncbi:(Acyl-carrier-protein) S-malonyltransferase [Oceanithermus profundus DSM 14977]|uniref:Malonyl CoA-acyl carrier protein transacylase n=1 Tax=Oceanithermus profundus (strain DSM 14977 / NBRC 100410 / VKM B-2274 / 506) TaxID=670487 RepID=E4U8Z3_OCEP5|nr:ACP S-malonyltransferase [Oceanithermus profundus]ADR36823.1 (Acyl-carrier-protein) S-malonyltransferase [Oceanithermus profundus DSM 14977]